MDPKTIEKFLRREQEHEQRGEFLATARAEMEKTGEVVSLARGLYTLPGHSCLAQYPVLDPSTAAASPDPTVTSVSNVPNIPTTPADPDLANDQDINPQTAPVTSVPNVPTASTTPDPANDQNTNSHATDRADYTHYTCYSAAQTPSPPLCCAVWYNARYFMVGRVPRRECICMGVENCLFCKIAAGQIPSKIVYQDQDVVAFEDINPQAPQHVLFIPRRHIASIADLTTEDGPVLAAIFTTAAKVARDLGIGESGYRFVANVGPDTGQSVLHMHFHLLGGRPMGWPPFPKK